jgi:hypothetical protein
MNLLSHCDSLLSLSFPCRPTSLPMTNRTFVSLLLISLLGCGEAGPPDEVLIPVTGSVRFGGKPTEGITVSFTPKAGTAGTGAFGLTDVSGNYSLIHRTQKPGVPAGEYTVTFSRFLKPDGSPVPKDQSPTMSGGRESVPAMWSDIARAGGHNSATVKSDTKTLDFALPAK